MNQHPTPRRRPEDSATIALMLLKASVLPPADSVAVVAAPRLPVLSGGAAAAREMV
ncbi:hypothetical protein [Ancylobacter sp.]|uniref:hypothetical protein n=1 Tax=Ancylobacter sp. TaxID=1872567 RepID=UPI003D0F7603